MNNDGKELPEDTLGTGSNNEVPRIRTRAIIDPIFDRHDDFRPASGDGKFDGGDEFDH